MKQAFYILWILIFISCKGKITIKDSEEGTNAIDTVRDETGKIKAIGVLVDGKKNGTWKFYDDNGNMDSAAYYYENKHVAPIDLEDYKLSEFNLTNDISISLPENWINEKNYNNALVASSKPINKTGLNPTVVVLQFPKSKDSILFDVVLANKEDLIKNYEAVIRHIIKKEISGKDAYEIFCFAKQNNIALVAYTTIIESKDKVYIITCMGEAIGTEFVKYEDVFKQIINSVKISS